MTEKIETTQGPGSHPALETIAAHVDRRLAGDERARMDEHLATCSECFEVYSATLLFNAESESVVTRRGFSSAVVAFSTLVARPAFRVAAGLAAVLLLVALPIWLSRSSFFLLRSPVTISPPPGPTIALFDLVAPVAELVQAVGERRLVEPRLTGGFRYARFLVMRSGEGPQGLDAQPPAVLGAVARIRERAEKDPSPEVLGALGVTYLVSGDVGAAVKALESATAQTTDNPRLWSDLAAAYLARARQADEPADIPKALEAAERAIALPDPPIEAWFNRALALEALPLVDAARKAWEDYLGRDSRSGWADEARQHLEALAARPRQSSVEEEKARVRAALEEGPATVDRLADESPQMLRDYVDDVLLPAWGEATLAGRPEAAAHREHVRLLGDALVRVTGDGMTRDTARALGAPARGVGGSDPLRSRARGHVAYREALRRDGLEQPTCAEMRAAQREMDAGGSPYASWARYQAVVVCLYPSQANAAQAELAQLESLAESRGYAQLLARVRQVQGLLIGARGDLAAALDRYGSARDLLRTTRDAGSEAKVLMLLAEVHRFLGEDREFWRDYHMGLPVIEQSRDARRRCGTLGLGVQAALQQGLPRSALHFAKAEVDVALGSGQATLVAESLIGRAHIQHRLGADDGAISDVRESRVWVARVPDAGRVPKVKAEVDRAEGEVLVRREPAVASRVLGEALDYYRTNTTFLVPPLHLLRSRAEAELGSDEAAEADLLAGIEAREGERAAMGDVARKVAFFDQAFPLFDDMVRLQVTKRRDPDRALAFVERGHARQLVDSLREGGDGPLDTDAIQRELPEGVALIYYQPLEDRLFAWTLTRAAAHFVERRVPSDALFRQVAAQRTAIENRAPLPIVHEEAARLHDELVRPLLPFLVGQRVLILIPDGVLQSVPFASLWDRQTKRYLVEDYLLGLAPSGTVFVLASRSAARAGGPPSRALVIGNPRFDRKIWKGLASLPGAEMEAIEVAGLYPRSVLLTGDGATKAAFLENLVQSDVVHFAGHASASRDVPSAGRLLFAPDPTTRDWGALYLRELDHHRLPSTRVVVLAACRTAAGAVSRVEGALTLGRPFLAAGAPSVVATLWDIEDSVSRRLFVAFHRALLAGNDPAQALRSAQALFVRDPDPSLSHPASWAAFVSMGGLDIHSTLEGAL